jgi:hypothetical protein
MLGLEQDDRSASSSERQCDGTTDDAAADDRHLEVVHRAD